MNKKIIILKPGLGHLDKRVSFYISKGLYKWRFLNLTPNDLTTLSVISTIIFLVFLHNRCAVLSVMFLLSRAYFDYADGMYARKYNLVTKFGDLYDHVNDIFVFGFPFFILLLTSEKYHLCFPMVLATSLASINTACSEKDYMIEMGTYTSLTLSPLSRLCVAPDLFKYFDCSFQYIVYIFLIFIFCS